MQISEVVRGDDLLSSTPRQLALYRALGARAPGFLHVPLVLSVDGRRLSKRERAPSVSDYRAAGVPAECIVGLLGNTLGLVPAGVSLSAAELVGAFDVERLPKEPTQLDAHALLRG
jgi:glutamyl-tRNA synthetase